MNTGLNLEKELQDQSEQDDILGALTPRGIASDIDYKKYLPVGERQNIGEDKVDCASRAPDEILETKFEYLIKEKIISEENIDWFKETGFINPEIGRFEIADAFTAIMSGTTRQGNSLKAPCHAIYEHGIIPKSMLPQVPSFDDYHNRDRITDEMIEIGKESKRRFPIRYVKDYGYKSKNEFLNTGGFAWGELKNGVYQRSENPFNHAFPYLTKHIEARDSYPDLFDGDFIKKLAPDYKLLPYAYRLIIKERPKRPIRKLTFCQWLKRLWRK